MKTKYFILAVIMLLAALWWFNRKPAPQQSITPTPSPAPDPEPVGTYNGNPVYNAADVLGGNNVPPIEGIH